MSALSSFARRLSLPLVLALCATPIAGCSTTDDSSDIDQDYGDPSYPPWDGDDDGAGEEPEEGDGGDSGGPDDGGSEPDELPPAPDEEGQPPQMEQPDSCDAESDVSLFISPDDSNSMSSPVQAREAALSDWGSVQSVAIRTWEFFNYYSFGYPAATEPGELAVSSAMTSDAGTDSTDYVLQIGVSSQMLAASERAPINVTLVLDTSGSMAGRSMDMLRESCRAIASSLREGDTVSMVTWNTDNAVILGGLSVEGQDDPILLAAIDDLEPGGGTDLYSGLAAGYELAEQVYDADRINRIVLMSDGGANAGITEIDLIAEHAGTNDEDGIYMVGVGVGDALTYNDQLMDAVTDAGKGASVFIANDGDAWSIFDDNFISTMGVAARNVQVRLDLPPGFEIVSTSAEEVSADVNEVEPQHLAPNDAMVFHQTIRTCAPELVDADTPLTISVHYLDALTFEARQTETTVTFGELLAADTAPLLKGSAVFTYAESLKTYKKSDPEGRMASVGEAFEALERAEAALPGDPELAEIRSVLEALTQ